jgi:DinB superfamily
MPGHAQCVSLRRAGDALGHLHFAGTAAEALDQLDAGYEVWIKGVRALGADGLARPCGPAEGPYAESPLGALVLHINRECLHHGAEITLLRDLYRWKGDRDGL